MKESGLIRQLLQHLLVVVALLIVTDTQAQSLRGMVRDIASGGAIQGATIVLQKSQKGANSISLASNPNGEFLFEQLKPGYYHCSVVSQGYESQSVLEILIASGKEQSIEFELTRSNSLLPEITIASSIPGRRGIQPLSEIPLSKDQTLRFPATFFDPARLAMAYPGVAQTDDGTNSMSIRGNSPGMLGWRLEGLDIVNPNHLPNAGTQLDRPAAASGGVLMFSAQMIDNSSLMTGAYPAGYGDAVAGVMDMRLRAGNKKEFEHTAQAGLGGLDIASEGPIKKGSGNSYLVNYRYSTVGLLGQLGVSFGDEQINFQDLSFHLHFNENEKTRGEYSLFMMAGMSENKFQHKADSSEVKYFKELNDIDFDSRTLISGGTGRWRIGQRHQLKAAVAYSSQENYWERIHSLSPQTFDIDNRIEERIVASAEWRTSYQNHQFSGGIQSLRQYFTAFIRDVDGYTLPDVKPNGSSIRYNGMHTRFKHQPWLRWDWASVNGKWSAQLGAQGHYGSVLKEWQLAPRGSLSYRINGQHKISLGSGIYKQDVPIWLANLHSAAPSETDALPYISSWQSGLKYTWSPNTFWRFSTEFFWQDTENIPVTGSTVLSNSPETINLLENYTVAQSQNYGIELNAEHSLNSGWFFLGNLTLLQSQYRIGNSGWFDSRWDIGHVANVTFGKEWLREKSENLTRTIGVGLRGVLTGGPRESAIDLAASRHFGKTIYDESLGYFQQYADYFRADLRVYWKRSLGSRRNSTFSLDLQNLTGQANLAYHYYDPLQDKILNKLQLSTIPNLSWRVEF